MGNSSSRTAKHAEAPRAAAEAGVASAQPPRPVSREEAAGAGEAEADVWRQEADKQAKLRNDCFERSKQAYASGDGALAKQLSLEGKEHDRLMKEANQKASDVVFKAKNALVDENSIDLHGLQVKEAVERTEARIEQCLKSNKEYLVIIVGRGNHSVDNIPKIKPTIQKLVRKYPVNVELDTPNPGCLTIRFLPPEARPKKQARQSPCIIL